MYQKFNTYGRLRSVVIGSYFLPEYFDSIKNPKIKDPLKKMSEEIHEDLNNFEDILKSNNIKVTRAPDPTGRFDLDEIYKPPLQVRDRHCVIGNNMIQLDQDFHVPLNDILPGVIDLSQSNYDHYYQSLNLHRANYNQNTNKWYSRNKYNELAGSDWPAYEDFVQGVKAKVPAVRHEMELFQEVLMYDTKEFGPLQGPNVINTPDAIILASNEYCDYRHWLTDHAIDTRTITQFTSSAGHIDGCFAVLGNNTILGIDPFIDYETHFPEYTIIKVPPESYQHQIKDYATMKRKVGGRWWLPGEEENEAFITYVNTYLEKWYGYVNESVFDVNVLALDEKTICVSNVLPEIEKQLKMQGIDCILVPWRHRFFVDGGLHCITLDLYRDR